MEPLIREQFNEPVMRENVVHESGHSSSHKVSVWWLWFFATLAIGGTLAASLQGRELGWPAFILLMGISIVSILAILTIFFNRQATLGDVILSDKEHANLYASFEKQRTPSLIVKAGKPEIANQAYYQLAQDLGLMTVEGAPPSVERLLSNKENAASAAIYRLHHTNTANDLSEEVVSVLDAEGNFRSFLVRVNSLKDGQLWQIENAEQQVLDDTPILSEAPIGLFSVRTDGSILKTNAVLQGWLGFDGETTPMHISEFIESPGALLESGKKVGRTVRCDTRLVTQKGVVSPVVMVGSCRHWIQVIYTLVSLFMVILGLVAGLQIRKVPSKYRGCH